MIAPEPSRRRDPPLIDATAAAGAAHLGVPPPAEVRQFIDETLVPGIPEIAASITEEIHRHSTAVGNDPEVMRETRASAEANLRLALAMWRDGQDPRDATPPQAAVAYARLYAHEGRPFSELLRVYRIAEEHLMRILRHELGEQLPRAMVLNAVDDATRFVFWRTDAVLERLEEVYLQERDAWQRSSAAARRKLLTAILGGQPVDVDDASGRLGYDLRRRHLGVILWSDAPPDDADADADRLGGVARRLADVLGTDAPLTDTITGHAVAAWFGAWEPIDPCAIAEAGELGGDPVRYAMGTCRAGLDGFRATHADAVSARKAAMLCAVDDRAVHYPAMALAALLLEDIGHARAFMVDEIGPLLDGDRHEALARIRETVQRYFELGTVAQTARDLGIHENTVQYRLQRAADLLGRPLRERPLELQVALALARLVPLR